MSYEEIPNLLYSGKQVYVKSSVGGGALPQVPMGVEGQNYNSPRSVFLSNILHNRAIRDNYTYYDENNNRLGKMMDIGQSPQTNNDSYFFENGAQKGQFDVIYYDDKQASQQGVRQPVQLGGRRRRTRGRKSGRRRTRRSRR
jgi:hypothetical protein